MRPPAPGAVVGAALGTSAAVPSAEACATCGKRSSTFRRCAGDGHLGVQLAGEFPS